MSNQSKELDLENMTIEQIASLDLESDKQQETTTPLLKIKRHFKTGVRAGKPTPIGLGRQH